MRHCCSACFEAHRHALPSQEDVIGSLMDLDGDSNEREDSWNSVSRRIGLRNGGQITEGAQD